MAGTLRQLVQFEHEPRKRVAKLREVLGTSIRNGSHRRLSKNPLA